jgi:transposase
MARFWFYAADDRPWQGLAAPIVVYIFAEGPSGRHVHEHLTGFSGVLQVDGYTGYDELAKPRAVRRCRHLGVLSGSRPPSVL